MDWGPPEGAVGVMTLRASLTYPQSPAASPPQHPSSFLKPCTDLWTSVRTRVCSSGCRSVCFCFGCDLRLLSTRTQRKKKHSVVPPRLCVCVCELVCVCVQQIIPQGCWGCFFLLKARDMLSKHGRMRFISSSVHFVINNKRCAVLLPTPLPPFSFTVQVVKITLY